MSIDDEIMRAYPEGSGSVRPVGFDLYDFLHRQIEWSRATFGPGERTEGLVDHIRKELDEVLEANRFSDGGAELCEWVDVVILALDGAWRAGNSPLAICDALLAKAEKNRARRWPDWRTAEPGKAIEHVRDEPEEDAKR